MRKSIWFTLSMIMTLVISCIPSLAAEKTELRSYPLNDSVNDYGTLKMKAPVSWDQKIERGQKNPYPTIVFKTGTAGSFLVMVTPIWNAPKDRSARQIVSSNAKSIERQSVEKTLSIKKLKGTSGTGYYYFATDPAPKPGEWKYMTQGIIDVGKLRVSFTIMTNEGQDYVHKEALRMLGSAKHE